MEKVNRNLTIEGARIIFRNFAGKEGPFNPAGKRNFCVLLDPMLAESLRVEGWNVKQLRPRDEMDPPQDYIQVAVSYDNIPPQIFLVDGDKKTLLDENSVNVIDWAEIENVDLTIRPYNWEANGRTGVKAYLKKMYVQVVSDALDEKYATYAAAEELPFD